MGLKVGDRLPEATLLDLRAGEPVAVPSSEAFAGRAAVFAMPGAFTRTCSGLHLPSVVRSAPALRAAGATSVIVLAVNDPFVMAAWGEQAGAPAAGVRMLADAAGAFTRAVGMSFDAPERGFFGRSMRYGMLVEDGVVVAIGIEESRTSCALSGGEALVAAALAQGWRPA